MNFLEGVEMPRHTITFRVSAVLMSLSLCVAAAAAQTTAKPQPKLPAAVADAFKQAYPSATIKNVVHETEDGQEQYEIESTNHARGLDVSYKPDGTLIDVEEEVTPAELPGAVSASIAKRFPQATFGRCERATEKQRVSYEIALKGAPVKTVELNADGTWISPKAAK